MKTEIIRLHALMTRLESNECWYFAGFIRNIIFEEIKKGGI